MLATTAANNQHGCINKSKFNDKQNISCHAYQITRFLYELADDAPVCLQLSVYVRCYVCVCDCVSECR